ncbi:Eco57I restriction-modification methylase domain-containing protein [Lactobacillus rodentium]|uniref:Type II restriction-modification system restriction subunit n=1 Tax=Lactobacillus rodentium TaxID=947835 RepID=A0A2Z6TD48_9LACO|nr:Eco57I restriction-modification methylase domain-containing protein [Lactobacillus rodentium]MCR1894485.1 Eco57I restriction-modification methylase domain-containing protein [Lactobacillus rodentium]GBG04805.1 type II restriction-modification system restriction subunit [Lactobacillus rodentium]
MSKEDFKFDVVIGNPPYQEETAGTSSSDKPIYNMFMEEAYKIGNIVELITPGRFLFNAGATPSSWNKKMLADSHLKVLYYQTNSNQVFNNTDIKGGVAVTYRDIKKDFEPIGTFTIFNELNSILKKVKNDVLKKGSLTDIIFSQNKFNLEELNQHYPELNRTDKRLESNIFKYDIFKLTRESSDDLKILGVINNKRCYRYVNKKYILNDNTNLTNYKVLLPKSNGSGTLGEVVSTPLVGTPLVGTPLVGYTRTFIGIGNFKDEVEANAALKYVKSKFARVMLGILKVTQDNNPGKWKWVPIQDFTSSSDIDWSKSISEIDQQLYKKYDLSEEEIDFIETHVKEMD